MYTTGTSLLTYMAQKNLQVRLDERLKNRAEKIFKNIGMDTPTAIRIFLAKVIEVGGIPFLIQIKDRKSSSLAENNK